MKNTAFNCKLYIRHMNAGFLFIFFYQREYNNIITGFKTHYVRSIMVLYCLHWNNTYVCIYTILFEIENR